MANVLVNDSSLSAIGAAIRAKNGSSDTYKPGDMAAAIAAIPTGGGSVSDLPERDVNYYDWDGTLLHSYTAAEFAQMTEHPAPPTRAGLTSQGWNWTLADAKTYVAKYGFLDIGHFVVSADGKTHIKVFANGEAGHDTVSFHKGGTPSLLVDWGDGTTETITASITHTYAAAGEYEAVITHGDNNGSKSFPYLFGGTAIRQIVWGDCLPSVGMQPWSGCAELQFVALPKAAPFAMNSSQAPSLRHLVMNGREIQLTNYASLATLCAGYDSTRGSFDIGGSSGAVFSSLRHATLPENAMNTSAQVTSMFKDNKAIQKVAMYPGIPSACSGCTNLKQASITRRGQAGVDEVILSSMFSNCSSLQRIVIPEGVKKISSSAFYGCRSLKYISLPSTLTDIQASAFVLGTSTAKAKTQEIHFKSTVPPTLANSNAFNYIDPTTCTIYVPRGYLTTYTTATNYPDPNTFTYVEED